MFFSFAKKLLWAEGLNGNLVDIVEDSEAIFGLEEIGDETTELETNVIVCVMG